MHAGHKWWGDNVGIECQHGRGFLYWAGLLAVGSGVSLPPFPPWCISSCNKAVGACDYGYVLWLACTNVLHYGVPSILKSCQVVGVKFQGI